MIVGFGLKWRSLVFGMRGRSLFLDEEAIAGLCGEVAIAGFGLKGRSLVVG
jgi:hypothetical protein